MTTETGLKPFYPTIAYPSGTDVKADFATSLAGMVLSLCQNPVEGYETLGFRLHNHKGSILARSRQMAVDQAMKDGCSHILFIDTDQTFPAELLNFWAAYDKDVVAANVAVKTLPSNPTARQKCVGKPAGEIVYTDELSEGLEKVWRVGTGVMLIKTSVFNRLGPKPWFDTRWVPELNDHMGEDWFFCELLEKKGIDIWVDHDASKFIGHIGAFNYKLEHAAPRPRKIQLVQASVNEALRRG